MEKQTNNSTMAFVGNPIASTSFLRPATTTSTSASTVCNRRRTWRRAVAAPPPWRCATPAPDDKNSNGSAAEETVSLQDLNARLDASNSPALDAVPGQAATEEEDLRTDKQKENDRLRAAEKFIEVDEGKFECSGCGYVYEPMKGDGRNNIARNTPFADIPESYTCGVCRTPKRRFVSTKKIIAGFAVNQSYGFGSNQMTGGDKSLLIFGGLVFFALLLLSGYALN